VLFILFSCVGVVASGFEVNWTFFLVEVLLIFCFVCLSSLLFGRPSCCFFLRLLHKRLSFLPLEVLLVE
jgi:hypothetical protein